jgi:hypothetical protein
MACRAPKFNFPDSHDAYCAEPKIKHLSARLSIGYECAVCAKLALKERRNSAISLQKDLPAWEQDFLIAGKENAGISSSNTSGSSTGGKGKESDTYKGREPVKGAFKGPEGR